MVNDRMVVVCKEDEGDGGDAKLLDGGRLEAKSIGRVQDGAKGVAAHGFLPCALFHVKRLGDDAEGVLVFVLISDASELPQEVIATGHPCSPKDDEGVGFRRVGPQLCACTVGTSESDIRNLLPDGTALRLCDLGLEVEKVMVVRVVGLKSAEKFGEFLVADRFFLHEVAVEEVDGDRRLGVVYDVFPGCGGNGGWTQTIGVCTELVEGFVGVVSADGVATEVVGRGLIGEVVTRTDEDDLFHAVGEYKIIGGELVYLTSIEE